MREILSGILTWPWFSARHGYDFNGWLVRHSQGNLCIDPVEMSNEVLEEISAQGVARVLLTNRNHFRASMRVKERTGARIAIHSADAAFARERGTAIEDELRPGQRVGQQKNHFRGCRPGRRLEIGKSAQPRCRDPE